MNPKEFIENFRSLLPGCQPEAAQFWCDFAAECVDQHQYVHFQAAESRDVSTENWLEVLYEGLRQTKEIFGVEIAEKVGALSCEHCCLYPGEMLKAAECLREENNAQEILAKIKSGEIDCTDLFSVMPPKQQETHSIRKRASFRKKQQDR